MPSTVVPHQDFSAVITPSLLDSESSAVAISLAWTVTGYMVASALSSGAKNP
ncbi:hypothetical protein Acr_08g0016750 [Actinidia rufa]|uniref:Uncharacterized protein n=1 Tax=Actinidia rufa TaxID=165716 RepID=A0A7J0F4Y0_9ERIC|nr:hypothetical protein Acr_08g0016750 [Actinidia rufa]